ncbi:MAG: hypothetical protein AAF310_03545 [Myxococcota bacterium]
MLCNKRLFGLVALLLVTLLQACNGAGEAKFNGKLAGKTFNPNKTVFAYPITKNAQGDLLQQPYLMGVMSSFGFNPEKDFSTLSPERLSTMRSKFIKSDVLVFRVMLPPSPENPDRLSFASATHPDHNADKQQAQLLHRLQLRTKSDVVVQQGTSIATFFQLSIDSYAPTGDPPIFEGRVAIERIHPLPPFSEDSFPKNPTAEIVHGRFRAAVLPEELGSSNMSLLLDLAAEPPEQAPGEQEKFDITDLFYLNP